MSRTRSIGGACLIAAGTVTLLLALGLPLGYALAESHNLGLLAVAMLSVGLMGLILITFGIVLRNDH